MHVWATRRPLVAALLAAAVAVMTLLPPSHIHLAADRDNHSDHGDQAPPAGVEHSHWAAHPSSGAAFDDEDGRVLFVDHPAIVRAARTAMVIPQNAVVAFPMSPVASRIDHWNRRTPGNAPSDGPARAPYLLRGPPRPSVL